jgi:hypothetical protein
MFKMSGPDGELPLPSATAGNAKDKIASKTIKTRNVSLIIL